MAEDAVETALAEWFAETLTHDNFRDWSDEQFAAALAPVVARKVERGVEAALESAAAEFGGLVHWHPTSGEVAAFLRARIVREVKADG